MKKETVTIWHNFSLEEQAHLGLELNEALKNDKKLKGDAAEERKAWNKRIAANETRIERIQKAMDEEAEERRIECYVKYLPDDGVKQFFEAVTGALIKQEPMIEKEFQLFHKKDELSGDADPSLFDNTPVDTPTPEHIPETLTALPLNLGPADKGTKVIVSDVQYEWTGTMWRICESDLENLTKDKFDEIYKSIFVKGVDDENKTIAELEAEEAAAEEGEEQTENIDSVTETPLSVTETPVSEADINEGGLYEAPTTVIQQSPDDGRTKSIEIPATGGSRAYRVEHGIELQPGLDMNLFSYRLYIDGKPVGYGDEGLRDVNYNHEKIIVRFTAPPEQGKVLKIEWWKEARAVRHIHAIEGNGQQKHYQFEHGMNVDEGVIVAGVYVEGLKARYGKDSFLKRVTYNDRFVTVEFNVAPGKGQSYKVVQDWFPHVVAFPAGIDPEQKEAPATEEESENDRSAEQPDVYEEASAGLSSPAPDYTLVDNETGLPSNLKAKHDGKKYAWEGRLFRWNGEAANFDEIGTIGPNGEEVLHGKKKPGRKIGQNKKDKPKGE